ncbi:nucleoside-diphosphate sugar epimerase/dehydratase [Rothia aerolata]|uniref:dTDP-glucose 4,6-dehydratase n=1 Tax=Rothia aerolata TaxID=1812262 RepID=A0A917INK5_9MICC|nr:nucleoside-diphosphate sugar epimerase/dehydratase [Rothia aerolata]GGH59180.1 dTDP-glucose 4,6-dehydratase [Rothia aerolata]
MQNSPVTQSLPVVYSGSSERKPWWRFVQMLLDALAWLIALPIGFFLRYGDADLINPLGFTIVLALAIVIQLVLGFILGLYRNRYSYGSFAEGKILFPVVVVDVVIIQAALLLFAWHIDVPRSVVIIAFPFAVIAMMIMRYAKRIVEDITNRPDTLLSEPVIVYGGGFVGRSLISSLMSDPESKYRPVAIVDDDPALRNARIHSVNVKGTGSDLAQLVQKLGVKKVFFAMSNPNDKLYERVALKMRELEVEVNKITGMISDVTGEHDAESEDANRMILEGVRGKIDYDINDSDISAYITGKRVLVTGAGGSIGSELCRQIVKYSPAELLLLDHDETLLMESKYSLMGSTALDDDCIILADIRDREALAAVFDERRPEVVFHAAALKHVSALEAYPKEAWKTNTLGSRNVLEAASKVDVDVFVNVSTDKAADPTTALGQSKRTAEMLCSWYGKKTGKRYVSVRFGNVFGSRGSVKPIFTQQIKDGGPITVTHPEATRFFMLIPDACLLVMLAGAVGNSGDVMVLDMGKPVRIYDVAENLRRLYERYDVDIEITQMRPGEKLEEVLFGKDEVMQQSEKNRFISHAQAPALDPLSLDYASWHENYLRHRGYERAEHKGQSS